MKKSTKTIIILFTVLVIAGFFYLLFFSENNNDDNGLVNNSLINPEKVQVYFFYSATCPHCKEQEPFMKELTEKYSEIQLLSYEIQYDLQNAQLFQKFLEEYNVPEPHGIPTTFIGKEYFVGYSISIGADIENTIKTEIINKKQELTE